ncbi:unnamed protein product [Ectocarpus fasciculatus]
MTFVTRGLSVFLVVDRRSRSHHHRSQTVTWESVCGYGIDDTSAALAVYIVKMVDAHPKKKIKKKRRCVVCLHRCCCHSKDGLEGGEGLLASFATAASLDLASYSSGWRMVVPAIVSERRVVRGGIEQARVVSHNILCAPLPARKRHE